MKTKNILYLLMLSTFPSCSYDFNLGHIDATEKLVLYCMPCADRDTTLIQLFYSQPVTKNGKADNSVPNAKITCMVNGQKQAVYYAESAKPSVPAGCYYMLGQRKDTDDISLCVEADGLPTISAETTIPASFPLKKVDILRKQDIDDKLQFRITFQDKENSEDYYGVRIVRKVIYEDMNKNEISEYSEAIDLELDDEPLLNNKIGLDATFDSPNSFYQYLYIWSDEQIQGKEYTLRLNTYYSADWEADDWNNTRRCTLYKMYFYTLSPELYRFLKSLNDNNNNELGNKGLAPLRSNYSNVENGIGVLGGCQLTETEWLKNVHL